MKYTEAKKLVQGELVWVPEYRHNGKILSVEHDAENRNVFLRVRISDCEDQMTKTALFHHTGVQQSKSIDEIVEYYLKDPKTRVFIDHNNETGVWLYSIVVVKSDAFWLCSFNTEQEAMEYIREHKLVMFDKDFVIRK